jgi:hypothetical protein
MDGACTVPVRPPLRAVFSRVTIGPQTAQAGCDASITQAQRDASETRCGGATARSELQHVELLEAAQRASDALSRTSTKRCLRVVEQVLPISALFRRATRHIPVLSEISLIPADRRPLVPPRAQQLQAAAAADRAVISRAASPLQPDNRGSTAGTSPSHHFSCYLES